MVMHVSPGRTHRRVIDPAPALSGSTATGWVTDQREKEVLDSHPSQQ